MEYSSYHVNVPQWREITVGSHLPAELRRFAEMAHNLWWTWNEDAKSLYSGLNPELWEEAEQNPVLFLERMDYEELEALTHDGNFMRKMENVYSTFKAYLDVEPTTAVRQLPISAWNMVWTGFLKSIPAVWAYWQVTI